MVACHGNTHGNNMDHNDVCIYCMLISTFPQNTGGRPQHDIKRLIFPTLVSLR